MSDNNWNITIIASSLIAAEAARKVNISFSAFIKNIKFSQEDEVTDILSYFYIIEKIYNVTGYGTWVWRKTT